MINNIRQIKKDSLTLIEKSSVKEIIIDNDDVSYHLSIWTWVSIFVIGIIIFLFLKLRKRKTNLDFANVSSDKVKKAKSSDIDMNNLMNSINGSKQLYKELSRVCHPDRFINTDKQSIAEEIFQEISSNKRDFEKLSILKIRIIKELNIKFK